MKKNLQWQETFITLKVMILHVFHFQPWGLRISCSGVQQWRAAPHFLKVTSTILFTSLLLSRIAKTCYFSLHATNYSPPPSPNIQFLKLGNKISLSLSLSISLSLSRQGHTNILSYFLTSRIIKETKTDIDFLSCHVPVNCTQDHLKFITMQWYMYL